MYVNTQLAAQANGAGYLAQDWGERAGIGSHKGQRFLVGAVDEVYIYTSALTQTQIRQMACVCEDSKGISICLLLVQFCRILTRVIRVQRSFYGVFVAFSKRTTTTTKN